VTKSPTVTSVRPIPVEGGGWCAWQGEVGHPDIDLGLLHRLARASERTDAVTLPVFSSRSERSRRLARGSQRDIGAVGATCWSAESSSKSTCPAETSAPGEKEIAVTMPETCGKVTERTAVAVPIARTSVAASSDPTRA
jgi:hypothetical protein